MNKDHSKLSLISPGFPSFSSRPALRSYLSDEGDYKMLLSLSDLSDDLYLYDFLLYDDYF